MPDYRDWQIFADFAYVLIAEARKTILPDEALSDFENNAIYAIDTTTIDLCLEIFWWAKFRKHKGAVKLHTMLDIKTEIPCYIYITEYICLIVSYCIGRYLYFRAISFLLSPLI